MIRRQLPRFVLIALAMLSARGLSQPTVGPSYTQITAGYVQSNAFEGSSGSVCLSWAMNPLTALEIEVGTSNLRNTTETSYTKQKMLEPDYLELYSTTFTTVRKHGHIQQVPLFVNWKLKATGFGEKLAIYAGVGCCFYQTVLNRFKHADIEVCGPHECSFLTDVPVSQVPDNHTAWRGRLTGQAFAGISYKITQQLSLFSGLKVRVMDRIKIKNQNPLRPIDMKTNKFFTCIEGGLIWEML